MPSFDARSVRTDVTSGPTAGAALGPAAAGRADRQRRTRGSAPKGRASPALLLVIWCLWAGCGRDLGPPLTPGKSAASCSRGMPSPHAVDVTFGELASNARAQAYRGRLVRVQGYLTIGFEDTFLYDARQPCQRAKGYGNAIFVNISPDVPYREFCGDRIVVIEGRYEPGSTSELEGLLLDVSFIESAGPPCR